MEMLAHLAQRRSIRRFLPKPVEDEKVQKLIQAAALAPSSRHSEPWQFFIVKNEQLRRKLAKTQIYTDFVARSPLAIVVTADEKVSAHWLEDGSIAAFSIQLAAADLGLGSCWGAVWQPGSSSREDYVRGLLKIPKNLRVICILGIGYPAESPAPKATKTFTQLAKAVE